MADYGQILRDLQSGVNSAHAQLRQMYQEHAQMSQESRRIASDIERLKGLVQGLQLRGVGESPAKEEDFKNRIEKAGDMIRYIDSIPGRRIPFDMLVTIPIGANVRTQQTGTQTVSQDGPFVAVARFACFQSAFQFSVRGANGQNASFQGRSFGRFRPFHSMWDLNDSQPFPQSVASPAFPGTGAAVYAAPSNNSPYRTMQGDALIEFVNQGAAWPRQNIDIPSAWWTEQINSPFKLAAFDFFERGETMQWRVTPSHINNPPAGNVFGFAGGAAPANSWPFADSQYDVHEGVLDPYVAGTSTAQDAVTRLPDGILYIGFHGFRIVQPPGPVRMT